MSIDLSETEEKAFKIFGISLIILSLFLLYYSLIGTEVYKDDTIKLDAGGSITKGLNFNKGQIIIIKYDLSESTDDINIMVETGAIYGGNKINLTEISDNKFKFHVNQSQQYYISFINSGDNKIELRYQILIEGYNNHSICFYAFFITLILGLVIVIIFFMNNKDE
ncbi:MAG: hypothetical protein JSV09_09430 [Thermoplasmata archaeon]|nr:MAG: hypothetical protein JSV09_09430 [Thermoplasmata archaeon]